jgi:hypothetical protein
MWAPPDVDAKSAPAYISYTFGVEKVKSKVTVIVAISVA